MNMESGTQQEITLHLQGVRKYICATDIIRFLSTPEMRDRLNLKKMISETTAKRWMKKMEFRWGKTPKGQYKDGHEDPVVVNYRDKVFLPEMLELEPFRRHWIGE